MRYVVSNVYDENEHILVEDIEISWEEIKDYKQSLSKLSVIKCGYTISDKIQYLLDRLEITDEISYQYDAVSCRNETIQGLKDNKC